MQPKKEVQKEQPKDVQKNEGYRMCAGSGLDPIDVYPAHNRLMQMGIFSQVRHEVQPQPANNNCFIQSKL